MFILSPRSLRHWEARTEVMSGQIRSILNCCFILLLQLMILKPNPINNPPIFVLHLRLLPASHFLKPKPIATLIINCEVSEGLDAVFLNFLVECPALF